MKTRQSLAAPRTPAVVRPDRSDDRDARRRTVPAVRTVGPSAEQPVHQLATFSLDGGGQARNGFGRGMQAALAQANHRPNRTGLPDRLKAGIETLSGFAMDDVRVHYNSAKPATVQALAYTQGTNIHLGPGQEKHLPHEAWHVVQQKQGRVKPTLQMKGVAINDDVALEREAKVMATPASLQGQRISLGRNENERAEVTRSVDGPSEDIVQLKLPPDLPNTMGLYNAQKSQKKLIYEGGRGNLAFSPSIRRFVLGRAGMKLEEGESRSRLMVTTMQGPRALPPDAAQLDHTTPWDDVQQMLLTAASNLKALPKDLEMDGLYMPADEGMTSSSSGAVEYVPTMYAARMYYNDVDNLEPMTGGRNAQKGNRSEQETKASQEPHPETAYIMLLLQENLDRMAEDTHDKYPSELGPSIQTFFEQVKYLMEQHKTYHQ